MLYTPVMSELETKEILKVAEKLLLSNGPKHPFSEKITSLLKDTAWVVSLSAYATVFMATRLLIAPFKYIEAVKEVGTPAQVKLAAVMFLGLPVVGTVATYMDGSSPISVVSTGLLFYSMSCFTPALFHANLLRGNHRNS